MTEPYRGPSGIVHDSGAPRPNGIAVASLVLGIVGLAVGVIPLFIGLVLSALPTVLAIAFGVAGMARASTRHSGFGPGLVGTGLGVLTAYLWTTGYGVLW